MSETNIQKIGNCVLCKGEFCLSKSEETVKELNDVISEIERLYPEKEFVDLLVPLNDVGTKVKSKWTIIFSGRERQYHYFVASTRSANIDQTLNQVQRTRSCEYVGHYQIGNEEWLLLFRSFTEEYLDKIANWGD